MRHLSWGLLLLAACEYPEYYLDPRNPCKLDSRVDVVVDAPAQLAPKSRAALRLLVTESREPANGLPVRVFLKDQVVFEGKTEGGTCDVSFVVPDLPDGSVDLRIDTKDYTIKSTVLIQRDYRILLTTDKPLYQPGQKMRIRALALSSLTLLPVEKEDLVLEVEDAKGNKVFKKKLVTSEFGVAAADFQLADEVVMGDYRVSAFLGKVDSSRTIGVKRYVLPKFRVTLETDRTFYLPGEKIAGTVRAEYFFGKPVDGEAVVKILALDAEVREVAKVSGKVVDGRMAFEIPLDSYFVGVPLNHGMANVLLAAQVTDTAGHAEKAASPVPVAKDALQITAVPESGRIVPGVVNRIYVATYTPDGQPAPSEIGISIKDMHGIAKTDEGGIAIVEYDAPQEKARDDYDDRSTLPVTITATDRSGRRSKRIVSLGSGEGGLLLRPSRTLYVTGTTMDLEIFTTVRRGVAFVDLVRAGQTMHSVTVPIADGRATHAIDLPGDVFGAVQVRAWCVMPNGDILRDSRLVYVQAADDLAIDVIPSKDVYEPGEDATIRFHVKDKKGPVRAALGVSIVDEAVYALQDMRPGLEKVYFTLQEELLEPKYGIKPLPETIERKLDALALMIFAEAEADAGQGTVAVRSVVNTLEQRQRVMAPRLNRWHRAFEQFIVENKVEYEKDGKWLRGFLEQVSPYVLQRDRRDAWGRLVTIEMLESLDSRFTVAYWKGRTK